MASAARRGQDSQSSDAKTVFRNELCACLSLTAPVGMTEEAKRDWLLVAYEELKHLPPDILRIGAQAARQKCDHPSKIVPTIIEETREMMRWRDEARRSFEERTSLPAPPPSYCTPAEASKILAEFGLKRAAE